MKRTRFKTMQAFSVGQKVKFKMDGTEYKGTVATAGLSSCRVKFDYQKAVCHMEVSNAKLKKDDTGNTVN